MPQKDYTYPSSQIDTCGESATAKLEPIYGREGLTRVQAATVVVLGLGGVGSSCAEALARGGVGHLILVDHDVVQQSNINRQAIAFHSTVGRKKTDVMRAMIADINPSARVETHDCFILAENVSCLLNEWCANADYVVDAVDTISTKLALAQHAERMGIRLVSSMGAANKLQPTCFRFADLYNTVNCPLCRIMRKEGRKRGIKHLRVLYSCEQPVDVPSREGAARSERSNLGTASFVPPIMGQMIAGDVLGALAGIGDYAEDSPDKIAGLDCIEATNINAYTRTGTQANACWDMHNPREPEAILAANPHTNQAENLQQAPACVQGAQTCHPAQSFCLTEDATPTRHLFDLHCHLDFVDNPTIAAQALNSLGISALSVTVTPEGYERTTSLLGSCENVRVGLGLHPWWAADGRCGEAAVEAFERLAKTTTFIGEIGLDFAKGREHTRDAQLAVFKRAIQACVQDNNTDADRTKRTYDDTVFACAQNRENALEGTGGNAQNDTQQDRAKHKPSKRKTTTRSSKVVSLHAVRAAGRVLDLLEQFDATAHNSCVFHWFSGTSEELQRAIKLGCYFSINPRMLQTKRGRAYVQAIPLDRLLLETDQPAAAGEPYDASVHAASLKRVLSDIAALRSSNVDQLSAHIEQTSKALLRIE